jgi:hypothetical protein
MALDHPARAIIFKFTGPQFKKFTYPYKGNSPDYAIDRSA